MSREDATISRKYTKLFCGGGILPRIHSHRHFFIVRGVAREPKHIHKKRETLHGVCRAGGGWPLGAVRPHIVYVHRENYVKFTALVVVPQIVVAT